MTNRQLKTLINKIGLSQSDLARLIYDTDKLTQPMRTVTSRYLTGAVNVPVWLPVILRLYIQANKINIK
jgi:hypothetical protein